MVTDAEIGDKKAVVPVEEAHPYYYIDSARCLELNRSLEWMILSRRCLNCRSKNVEVGQPPSVKEQIKHIVRCCAKDKTFIRTDMPMQEIVFRMLLAVGNAPMSLDNLHYQLTEQWATPANPMNLSKDGLKRILENDNFYGHNEVLPKPTIKTSTKRSGKA